MPKSFIARLVPPFVVAVATWGWVACQTATEIVVVVTTDAPCADVKGTQVTVGKLGPVETRAPSTSTSACDTATKRVGSVVLIPSGSNDEEVAVKVVLGLGRPAESCTPPNYEGCIVARRALRFIPHKSLQLEIPLDVSCASVVCGATDTCSVGACVSATLPDPERCTKPAGCGSTPPRDAGKDSGPHDASTSSDGGNDSGPRTCAGRHGPKPVAVAANSRTFCIDSTEVSRAQYLEFLDTSGTDGPAPAVGQGCGSKTDHVPSSHWPPALAERDLPVVDVDWCDAFTFCAWAGKRLCGSTANGEQIKVTAGEHATNAGEMYYACSKGGTQAYPYGDTEDGTKCNTGYPDGGLSPLWAVGTQATCQGGFPGIYNLSGNVAEWQNACDGSSENSVCFQGAGANSRTQQEGWFACGVKNDADPRLSRFDDLGFRCCSDFTSP